MTVGRALFTLAQEIPNIAKRNKPAYRGESPS
jgi:hypothetical protein